MKTLAEIMPELNQACDEIDKLYQDAEKALEGSGIAVFDGAFNKKIEYKRINGRYRIGLNNAVETSVLDGGEYLYPFEEASRSLKIELAPLIPGLMKAVEKEANRLLAEARKILAAQTKA